MRWQTMMKLFMRHCRRICRKRYTIWYFLIKPRAQDYFVEAFREMRNSLHSDMTNIILGPTWAHGCTDAFYEKLRRLSEEYGGLPMHIHTLQTPYQREYGERKYGKSLLAHMKDCGIVDEHLVLGHAVYLTESDMELLGEAHASVTHHPQLQPAHAKRHCTGVVHAAAWRQRGAGHR